MPRETARAFVLLLIGLSCLCMANCRGLQGASTRPASPWSAASGLERFECIAPCMGMQARIVMYAENRAQAKAAADAAIAEMQRLDWMLSDYRDDSETARVGYAAGGEPVRVSSEFLDVLGIAQRIADCSGGAFDVSIGPVTQLWRRMRKTGTPPTSREIAAAQRLVNWRDVGVDREAQTVRLAHPGMRLDFGGIGKGFACDRGLAVLQQHGNSIALVSIAGDIRLGAPPPGQPGWEVLVNDGLSNQDVALTLSNCAISTSGDAEQFVVIDGQRISHILAPGSFSEVSPRVAATVIANDATHADALATAVTLMGEPAARELIDSTPGAAARIVRLMGSDGARVVVTRDWPLIAESAR